MLETSPGVAAEEPPCASCGAPLDGPYCSSCGQAVAAPIAVRRVAGDLKEQLVGLDYRALATVRELFVAPGAMLRGYLAGRRQPYTNPLKLLFLSASLYLLVVTTFDLQVTPAASGRDTGLAVAALMNYLVFVFLVPAAWWLRIEILVPDAADLDAAAAVAADFLAAAGPSIMTHLPESPARR